jgi:hypothetical protein
MIFWQYHSATDILGIGINTINTNIRFLGEFKRKINGNNCKYKIYILSE